MKGQEDNKVSKEPIIISDEDFIKAVKAAFPKKTGEIETKVLHTYFGTILINKTKD